VSGKGNKDLLCLFYAEDYSSEEFRTSLKEKKGGGSYPQTMAGQKNIKRIGFERLVNCFEGGVFQVLNLKKG